ncbi:MAG: type VI secretion system tube protein TssD [Chitinophagales bacterium]
MGYSESFNANSTMPMTITLNISAKKVSVGDASHEKQWK